MKKLTEQEFDNLIKSQLYDFEKEPPISVFHALEKSMNKPSFFIPGKSWFWILGTVAGIVALIFILNPFNKQTLNTAIHSPITHNSSVPEIKMPAEINNASIQTANNVDDVSKQKTTTSISQVVPENYSTMNMNTHTGQGSVTSDHQETIKQHINPVINPKKNSYQITVKAASCHNANGKVSIKTDNNTVQFSWVDLSVNKPMVDNLKAGKYTVLAHLENSILDTLLIVVPDSGKVKASFNMFELTVGDEVFSSFENNSMIDHNRWNKANDVSFKWSFGDDTYSTLPEVQHSYTATGKYVVTLVAISSYGCKDSITKSMVITIPTNFEKLPNVFSPNGDGINDVFSPVLYDMQSVECTIFNRNGEMVYEWKTLNGSWDGKIRNTNQLAAKGTYYYVLKGVTKSGKNIFHKGMVQLEL